MYAHEFGPSMICRVKVFEMLAVRIGPPRADEDGFHLWGIMQVVCEGSLHRFRIFQQTEGVEFDTGLDKVFHLLEGVLRLYVDALDGCIGAGVGVGGGEAFLMESAKVENQENEAVFAAIVCKGKFGESDRVGELCRQVSCLFGWTPTCIAPMRLLSLAATRESGLASSLTSPKHVPGLERR